MQNVKDEFNKDKLTWMKSFMWTLVNSVLNTTHIYNESVFFYIYLVNYVFNSKYPWRRIKSRRSEDPQKNS